MRKIIVLKTGSTLPALSAEAFAVGGAAWGVQFHPEFDAEIVTTYIEHYATNLRAEGQDPDALAAGVHDTPAGGAILRRFLQITMGS